MTQSSSNERSNISESMMQILKHSGIDKANLSELVQIASGLNKNGIKIDKVGPIGIPFPDGIKVHTRLEPSSINSLIESLSNMSRINSVEIFPRGLPKIDLLVAEVDIR